MMMSIEEKKQRRQFQRAELIEAVDRLQSLSHRRDAIAPAEFSQSTPST